MPEKPFLQQLEQILFLDFAGATPRTATRSRCSFAGAASCHAGVGRTSPSAPSSRRSARRLARSPVQDTSSETPASSAAPGARRPDTESWSATPALRPGVASAPASTRSPRDDSSSATPRSRERCCVARSTAPSLRRRPPSAVHSCSGLSDPATGRFTTPSTRGIRWSWPAPPCGRPLSLMATSNAAFSCSSPAFRYTSSSHKHTISSSIRRCCHLLYSALPAFFHPRRRARRQRRLLSQQPAQCQLKVMFAGVVSPEAAAEGELSSPHAKSQVLAIGCLSAPYGPSRARDAEEHSGITADIPIIPAAISLILGLLRRMPGTPSALPVFAYLLGNAAMSMNTPHRQAYHPSYIMRIPFHRTFSGSSASTESAPTSQSESASRKPSS